MTPQQREEYLEAVMLNVNISGRAAIKIVDRVIRPALANAWDDGYRNGYSIGHSDDPAALTNYQNPYEATP